MKFLKIFGITQLKTFKWKCNFQFFMNWANENGQLGFCLNKKIDNSAITE